MFKKKFLSLSTKTFLKKNKIARRTIRYVKAKNIGIIYSVEDKTKHHAVKLFVKELKDEGKDVQVISFMGKGKENYEFLFDFITLNDVSFWGKLKSNSALQFASTEFDYLFNIDKDRNQLVENIMARCKAKCRIGVYSKDNGEFYELMINIKSMENTDEIIRTMHHYAKKIGGNGK